MLILFVAEPLDEDDEVKGQADAELEALILSDASATSRLANEFQIIDIIGKGGFGEVLKVSGSTQPLCRR